MPKITFIQPDGRTQTINASENCSIMEIAIQHKVKGIEGVCGGSMACSTCHIYIHPDWYNKVSAQDNEQSEEEIDILDMAYNIRTNSRLSCQIIINKELDGIVVALPGANFEQKSQIKAEQKLI